MLFRSDQADAARPGDGLAATPRDPDRDRGLRVIGPRRPAAHERDDDGAGQADAASKTGSEKGRRIGHEADGGRGTFGGHKGPGSIAASPHSAKAG